MRVYLYVCLCLCMFVCVCVYMCVCVWMFVCVCMFSYRIRIRIRIRIRNRIRNSAKSRIRIRIRIRKKSFRIHNTGHGNLKFWFCSFLWMLTNVQNISWIWNGAVRGAVRLKWFYPTETNGAKGTTGWHKTSGGRPKTRFIEKDKEGQWTVNAKGLERY